MRLAVTDPIATDSPVDARTGLVSFEAHGVSMWLASNRREARDRLPEVLPPGWQPRPDLEAKHRLAILGDERGTYSVDLGGVLWITGVSLDVALDCLQSVVRVRLAQDAPDRIFLHAGVVAHAGGALLLPGMSFAGKSTLVAALERAGATHYSDEYALLDPEGLVHPFPKPISLRGDNHQARHQDVEGLGRTAADQPLPIRAVIFTRYRPASEWAPKRLSPGQAALALLAHAVPARDRPTETMHAIARATKNATVLEGDRGEADHVAPLLLAELEARAA
jgi:hypothetical protein